MARIHIKLGHIGIIYKDGIYTHFIEAGKHSLSRHEKVTIYNLKDTFTPEDDLSFFMHDEALVKKLDIIEISDSEIALKYIDGRFEQVVTTGKYAFWKDINHHTFTKVDLSKIEITEDIPTHILKKTDVAQYTRNYFVQSHEKALLYVNGKLYKELTPGFYTYWSNPIPIDLKVIDTRLQKIEIASQEILTADKAGVRVNIEFFYQIIDIYKALVDNKEYARQLYTYVQLAIREYMSSMTLDELLEKKGSLKGVVLEAVADKVEKLGVKVTDCGLKDIILPGEIKNIMNQVLVAQKAAQANVITRREETASARSLLNTAKLMEDNPMLFKLKEMEYIEKIAERINNISVAGGGQIVEQLKSMFS